MQAVILLFDKFETLDAFGPVEVLGACEDISLAYCSMYGGEVTSSQGLSLQTLSVKAFDDIDVLLVPGGRGTRRLVHDSTFISDLKKLCNQSNYVLTVCTGSALLAQTGLLDGKSATSNKKSFEWVKSLTNAVDWQNKARWTTSGNIYTSSGVSAGIDMTLGFVADLFGQEQAEEIAYHIEYIWNSDKDNDPFSV